MPYKLLDDKYDTYIYDYRGYGRSDGAARFKAMVEDTDEILSRLEAQYPVVRIYGMSLGAVIASHAIKGHGKVNAVILDGIVSELRDIAESCKPGQYDPVDIDSASCKKVSLIVGEKDQFFTTSNTKKFLKRLGDCGNTNVFLHPNLGHAFSEPKADEQHAASLIRAALIREWLAK